MSALPSGWALPYYHTPLSIFISGWWFPQKISTINKTKLKHNKRQQTYQSKNKEIKGSKPRENQRMLDIAASGLEDLQWIELVTALSKVHCQHYRLHNSLHSGFAWKKTKPPAAAFFFFLQYSWSATNATNNILNVSLVLVLNLCSKGTKDFLPAQQCNIVIMKLLIRCLH